MTGELSKKFLGVGIGPLSKILAVKENDLQNNSADENEMNEGFNKRIRFLFDEYFRTYSYLANT